ncbi:MAG: glycosyltransferase family 4 protein [Thermoproteota archaeon]|nr:glycosyltransferase family 4 protein [Candidatus Brockarchaeota archaeon]
MRIAFVYDAVYPWVKGGVERRIYELGRRLSRRHEVHWFSLEWWGGGERSLNGILLHGVGGGRPLYVNGKRSISEALYFGLKLISGLKHEVDFIDVQAFPYFSCFSSKIRSMTVGACMAVTWHELWGSYWFEYLGPKGLAGWAVERAVLKLTRMHIAVSDVTRRSLESVGVNAELIPNGIDFEHIVRVQKSGEESDLVFAGRLVKEKNVDLIIRAVRILKDSVPDIKCVIIGDGPEKHALVSLSEQLGVRGNIVFKGFLADHDEVISCMKSSKVFILPSTREGFGIVVLEANACGLPVITVRHERNAACSLVEEGLNGFTCPVSPEKIAEKTLEAMGRDMRQKCVSNASKYDWSSIVSLYESLLKKV